ncbi:MAG: amidohydrolase, partial [Verrucomicrobiales bacterium]|nr:amidohydrolase [Verrucomicrobiales bacterium]
KPGQLADLIVLSDDYFKVPEAEIKNLHSVLTILGGKPVWAEGEFREHAPPDLPVMPNWSPVARFGGYGSPKYTRSERSVSFAPGVSPRMRRSGSRVGPTVLDQLWGSGCDCFAF